MEAIIEDIHDNLGPWVMLVMEDKIMRTLAAATLVCLLWYPRAMSSDYGVLVLSLFILNGIGVALREGISWDYGAPLSLIGVGIVVLDILYFVCGLPLVPSLQN